MTKYALLLFTAMLSTTIAQENTDNGFKAKTSVGLDIASGNSELTAVTADLELSYEADADMITAAALYAYAETDGELSRQNSRASLKYDRTLSERTYLYMRVENEYDKIALIDYRITAGPGFGVFLVKNDRVTLKTDLGLSYIDQQLRDSGLQNDLDEVLALRATERLDIKLSDSASVWQAVEYMPDTDDFDSYLLNTEVGLETKVTGSTSLRVAAGNRHYSTPPEEVDKDDFTLKASLVYAFGG